MNKDDVTKFILDNVNKLSPEKIKALSALVAALGEKNEAIKEPNVIPANPQEDLMVGAVDLLGADNIQIDDNKPTKIRK